MLSLQTSVVDAANLSLIHAAVLQETSLNLKLQGGFFPGAQVQPLRALPEPLPFLGQ